MIFANLTYLFCTISWSKLVDREIDRELKSDDFESLLADYTNSLVELHGLYG
jgi:hypothetical protein